MINFYKLHDLSDSTKQLYTRKFEMLLHMFDNDISILSTPWKVYYKLREKYTNWYTINGFIAPVHNILTKMPEIARQLPQKRIDDWMKISKYSKERCHMLKINNQNRKNITVTHSDILERLKTLEGKDKLLVAMYTYIPPGRCEYCDLLITRTQSEYESSKGNNLVYLPESGECFIEVSNYKTAKSYGTVRYPLPVKLVDIIKQNVKDSDRYLFTAQDGEPYTRSAFSEIVRTKLTRIFGEPLSINSLRHIYVMGHVELGMDPKKRVEIATKMGHSTDTQVRYLYVDKKNDNKD